MPKVKLIHYTGKGHSDAMYAARLLVYTKNTRLRMTPEGMKEIFDLRVWPDSKIVDELKYMADTIPSSWEFVDVVFAIEGVTRACAQQMTRTRNASYAMQSQRVTDMSGFKVLMPSTISVGSSGYWHSAIQAIKECYSGLVAAGVPAEDARGILPLNVHCNLVVKYNLRSFVELIRTRDSLRVQGEYVDIVRQMKDEVLTFWPWAEFFFEPKESKAIRIIEEVALGLKDTPGAPSGAVAKLAKAADLIKGGK